MALIVYDVPWLFILSTIGQIPPHVLRTVHRRGVEKEGPQFFCARGNCMSLIVMTHSLFKNDYISWNSYFMTSSTEI
jgi:hypothetical protein